MTKGSFSFAFKIHHDLAGLCEQRQVPLWSESSEGLALSPE